MEFFEIFQYGFVVRGIQAGVIVAVLAPFIGIFLVLRRYSLIADTLAHVSLSGVALGFLLGLPPVWTAIGTTVLASFGIERLRTAKRIYGESALALFLSGSLALATVLLSWGRGFDSNIFNYLFGSIVTVTQTDVYTMLAVAALVIATLVFFYKELIYISFDEESARVSGLPVNKLNFLLVFLAALSISLAIPVVGVLLIAALVVVPVIAAMQLKRGFTATLLFAVAISLASVLSGVGISVAFDLSTGGTIVLIALTIFVALYFSRR